MPNFDDKFMEQLKSKVDIVDLIGSYAHLQRKGGQYWACCPLPGHTERTPSFAINQDGQFYHCFGCGKGGDAVRFIEEVESLEFVEAVRFLCERYKIEMPAEKENEKNFSSYVSNKDRILSLLKDTAHFYVDNLKDEKAIPYIEYMRKRGLTDSVIRRFGLGASLDFATLPKYLASKGYTEKEMLDSGAISKNERGKLFDCQAERLVFPMINNFGNVIAFSGRILEVVAGVGKYKNTRETSVFVKNKYLYNVNNLKKAKLEGELKNVIVVEGHMDAVSVYNGGFHNVVASMGTSFTKEQAKLLKRYSNNVLISYDGDAAGQKGMVRGLEILRDEGLTVKVVRLPNGLDPDDVIKKFGSDEYQRLLDEALPLIDYKLWLIEQSNDLQTSEGKRKYISECEKVISECETQAETEERLKALSKKTGITYDSLQRDIERGGSVTLTNVEEKKQDEEGPSVPDGIVKAESFILSSILYGKPYADKNVLNEVTFKDKLNLKIAEYVKIKSSRGEDVKISVLPDVIDDGEYQKLDALLLAVESVTPELSVRYYEDCVRTIKRENVNAEIKELNLRYSTEQDVEKAKEISKKIKELTMQLIKL